MIHPGAFVPALQHRPSQDCSERLFDRLAGWLGGPSSWVDRTGAAAWRTGKWGCQVDFNCRWLSLAWRVVAVSGDFQGWLHALHSPARCFCALKKRVVRQVWVLLLKLDPFPPFFLIHLFKA